MQFLSASGVVGGRLFTHYPPRSPPLRQPGEDTYFFLKKTTPPLVRGRRLRLRAYGRMLIFQYCTPPWKEVLM